MPLNTGLTLVCEYVSSFAAGTMAVKSIRGVRRFRIRRWRWRGAPESRLYDKPLPLRLSHRPHGHMDDEVPYLAGEAGDGIEAR